MLLMMLIHGILILKTIVSKILDILPVQEKNLHLCSLCLCFSNRSLLLSAGAVDNASPTASDPFYGMENWQVHIKGIS